MAEILPKHKKRNATGSDIFDGLIGDKGLNMNATVDIPIKTVIIAVIGIVAAVGLSVLAAYYIKKAVNK
jgi:hypothetical protein